MGIRLWEHIQRQATVHVGVHPITYYELVPEEGLVILRLPSGRDLVFRNSVVEPLAELGDPKSTTVFLTTLDGESDHEVTFVYR